MRVFITGSTGYIGFSAAKRIRAAGHEVFGLTRSEQNAKLLKQNEIIPIIGSMQNVDSFINTAANCDVVIHAAADYKNNTAQLDKSTVETFINSAKSFGRIKKLIYTSGTWVYGSSNNHLLTEESKTNPIKIVNWRPEVDNLIVDTNYLDGIVLRPGCVYGGIGSMTNEFFNSALNDNSISIIGNGNNRWPMIHVDDLAEAYLLAVENDNLGSHIFNIVETKSASINEIISSVEILLGSEIKKKYMSLQESIKLIGTYAEVLVINQLFDTTKAEVILNWEAKHKGFIEELELYYSSWKAYHRKH